ncbi:hydroxyethylthiazole kinase [Thiomonas bhubaneswarensis]|uniref:Hydroxyethylthiazole kinase n=1 Tax=Thiomonas bhubaneswarensis TaxID=339866 RepID=A0A0K6I397_9BURK|nr:hydroxyethylthiazole kinase [Thiomonas bhubaneswarensis]CUA97772.1 hydroxyethylthiazole kinase [Thiomonas bhubaneswarensis]
MQPTPDSLWADVLAVRQQQPLVHNITNFVVMNYNANALLALGAAPVMAHAREEVVDMAGIAQALVLNIGTLEPRWIESMRLALQKARERGIPVVLDPVGAGATPYRNQAVAELLEAGNPTVLRGNASEILSVAGVAAATRGVDSSAASDDAVRAARELASRLDAVVCVSGATDHVLAPDGRHARLSNGHVWMTRVTGVGCSASALIGAFSAVQPDAFHATTAAMAYLGVVGEVAAEQVQAAGRGVGQLQIALLDGLQLLDAATFLARLRLQTGN